MTMRTLSKSKLMNYRQCPKRLWLEIHRRELRADSSATQASFAIGHQVGDIARRLYDPKGKGALIDVASEGFDGAFERSKILLETAQPIFEAGFAAAGALAFADVMLPVKKGGQRAWRMVEVKSSTEVKPYYHDDAAIQAFIARQSGVSLAGISLAYIDNQWVYPGNEDYAGLLVEQELTNVVFPRGDEVAAWIADAHKIAKKPTEPVIRTGKQCAAPYECGFYGYCQGKEPQAEYPVAWLPRVQSKKLKALLEEDRIIDLRDVPDDLLNDQQLRVKKHTLSGKTYFNAKGAAAELAAHKLPAYFLDFETIMFAVPIWKGTRPYQQIPFQFSLHKLSRKGKLTQQALLDLSGEDPSKGVAEALIAGCGETGPVYAYNAGFESRVIRELAERFPRLKKPLLAIVERIVDLLPVARGHFYHPDQCGSWSIKAVLPAVVPELTYDDLEGVQNGGMAQEAFLEAIHASTTQARKAQLHQHLLDYCKLDTYAMVRLWQVFAGRTDLVL
jgi:hypothetical protein